MFKYSKFLQIPINIRHKNPRLANVIATQYGGPNGELGASLRYLSQRYTMPDDVTKGLLTDIGVEELGHLEMVGTLVRQLSADAPADEWAKMGSWEYYADNGASVYPQSSQGSPFNAAAIAVTGDPLTNLYEDLAADAAITHAHKTAKNLLIFSRKCRFFAFFRPAYAYVQRSCL